MDKTWRVWPLVYELNQGWVIGWVEKRKTKELRISITTNLARLSGLEIKSKSKSKSKSISESFPHLTDSSGYKAAMREVWAGLDWDISIHRSMQSTLSAVPHRGELTLFQAVSGK